VRVFAENNPTTYRVLSVDLSDGGIFLQMPMPFAQGTRLSLALEAGGKVLPFAEGEVAWRRTLPLPEETKPGAAVRFTRFKSRRANQLVTDLVSALHKGEQPKPLGKVRLNRWIVAIVASTLIGLVAGASYVQLPSPAARLSPVSRPLPSGEVPQIEFTEIDEPAVPELPALADAVDSPRQWLELNPVPAPPQRPRVWAWRPKAAPAPVVVDESRHPLRSVPVAGAIAIGATKGIDTKHLEARAAPSITRPEPDGKPQQIAVPAGALKTIHLVRAGKGFRFDFDLAKGSKLVHLTTLKDPSRLAIDLAGAAPKKPMVVAGIDGIQRVRLARYGNGTRVVLDLTMPVTVTEQSGTHVVVAPE
jgi:hypothetical protein